MEVAPKIPAQEPAPTFDKEYINGELYDFPFRLGPTYGEKGIEGVDGIKYDAHYAESPEFEQIAKSSGDKLVFMRTPSNRVEAITASEVIQRFKNLTRGEQNSGMILVPRE